MSFTIETEKNKKMSFLDVRVNLQQLPIDKHISK